MPGTGPTAAGLLAAVAFTALGHLTLSRGHPFEDAYILFKYVAVHGDGHGWAFHPGGPPTLGFVDLLWAWALAAVHALGPRPAHAALLLNAVCLGITVVVLSGAAPRRRASTRSVQTRSAVAFAGAAWLVASPPGAAALGGFGTLAFALSLLVTCLAAAGAGRPHGLARPRPHTPLLGALTALVRPEGLVPAAAASCLPLAHPATRRRALPWLAAGLALGAGALAWVWATFGDPVPLPLQVKGSEAGSLPGLVSNLRWFRRLHGPAPILVGIALLLATSARCRRHARSALVPAALAATLLLPLSFAAQLQNVVWRFQAPILLPLVWGLFHLASRHPRRALAGVVVLAALAPSGIAGSRRVAELARGLPDLPTAPIAWGFAAMLGPEHTLVVTEAGLMARWTRARVVDLVGLNTREFARRPLERDERIGAGITPDAVSFHAYGCLDRAVLDAAAGASAGAGAPRPDPVWPRPPWPEVDPSPRLLRTTDIAAAWIPDAPHAEPTSRAAYWLARWLGRQPPQDWHVLRTDVGRRVLIHAVRRDVLDAAGREPLGPSPPSRPSWATFAEAF